MGYIYDFIIFILAISNFYNYFMNYLANTTAEHKHVQEYEEILLHPIDISTYREQQ